VKSLGAAQAFNYRDADVVEQIRKYTGGTLKYSFDCIGTPSIDLCTQCSSTEQPGTSFIHCMYLRLICIAAQVAYITGSPTVKPSNVTHHYILLLHCFEEDLALQTFLRDFLTNIAYPRLIDGNIHCIHWTTQHVQH
jgi:threonine dehydrogenase-like Zn-dependent dehydrogenase